MCNLNVILVLEFISRDLYLLFDILLSSKFQNSIFYQHMRPKSDLKFPRPLLNLMQQAMHVPGVLPLVSLVGNICTICTNVISINNFITNGTIGNGIGANGTYVTNQWHYWRTPNTSSLS